MKSTNKAYSWVPSLYLAESLPYSAVMIMSVIMFKELGLTDTQITLYTGWLGLPWVIKPIWSPIIDNLKTKRWWIITMQYIIGVALGLVALTIPTSFWLQGTLALFMLLAFSSATHDISADGFYIIGLEEKEQEFYVGIRNTCYRIGMVIGQGGLISLAGLMQNGTLGEGLKSVSSSWMAVFFILAVMMLLIAVWHTFMLPKVEVALHDTFHFGEQMKEFGKTLKVFISKPFIISSMLFMLLFRLPEGLLTKIVPLFLTRSVEEGGLGMNDIDYGFIYGTLGVIGLLLGGIAGGWLVSRYGLKRMLWPLVLCITLPDVVYVYLSYYNDASLWLIGTCICIEQIGYGLGFAAYTLYLVTFSRGERSTAVFSICTAFQYFGGAMLPGMVSGLISDSLGYFQFFLVVMGFCLVTFAVTACIHLSEK